MDGVEIVVDSDPAHAHRVGDIFDGPSQYESASIVEHANGALLALASQHRKGITQFGFDGVDEPFQSAVERRQPNCGDGDTVPNQSDIARLSIGGIDERSAHGVHQRFGRTDQWVHTRERVAIVRHRTQAIRRGAFCRYSSTDGADSAGCGSVCEEANRLSGDPLTVNVSCDTVAT